MKPGIENRRKEGFRDGWPLVAGILIAIGLALRIWKAWTGHLSTSPDFGVVALAAKHMAEGTDFPVFFYGQPYMGNVEPVITAFLCRLAGLEASGFMVNLATALTGAFLLLVVYLWARDAGSPRAGVLALLFCIVGSDTNFHYSAAARCAYMAIMVCGALSLWLASRIASTTARGERAGILPAVVLGLAAGIGWWGTQLVVIFLGTAGLILLTAFRRNSLFRVYLPALGGFLIGSFPWWWWNLHYSWGSLDLGTKLGRTPVLDGFSAFGRGILRLVELSPLTHTWNAVKFALFLASLVLFLVVLARDKIRRENSGAFHFRLAAPLLFVVGAVISVSSDNIRFPGIERYLLPLFPAFAVMLGVSCDWLLQKWRFPLGWIVMVLLIPEHIYLLPKMPKDLVSDGRHCQAATRLADELGPRCDGVSVGDFSCHWMNFATGERLCVATLPRERYAPYGRRAELAENPAFLGNYFEIRSFLRSTMGSSTQTVVAGVPVDYGLTPPADDWRYVEPTSISAVEDTDGKSCGSVLTDAVMDTCSTVAMATNSSTLTFFFNRPVSLCGIRFISPCSRYPGRMTVDIRAADDGSWHEILPLTWATGYFWSGRHAMLRGIQSFFEVRSHPKKGGADRVRLKFPAGKTPQYVSFGEVLILEQAPAPEGDLPSVEACIAALRLKGVKQFYGPRWLSGHIALAMKGELSALAPSSIFRAVNELSKSDSLDPHPVVVRETAGFMMDVRNAGRSRSVLSAVGLRWEETLLGRYVLLVVQRPGAEEDAARYPTFYWTEQGCFAADMSRFAIGRSHSLYEKAVRLRESGDQAGAVKMLRQALDLYPGHQPARRALVEALEGLGRKEEAAADDAILKAETVPPIPAPIQFPGGIEFLGLAISNREETADGFVEINYFWKCPPSAAANRPTMFVHFLKGEEILFQDDHGLLEEIPPADLQDQPFERIFTEHRRVKFPASAQPGGHRITVGLYHVKDGKRLSPKTKLKQHRREVTLPVAW